MKTEYDANAAFLYPYTGEQERRFFYVLILAYTVERTGVQDGKIKGNLYELDYEKHYVRVKDNTLAAGTVTLVYEHGTRKPCNPCCGRKGKAGIS